MFRSDRNSFTKSSLNRDISSGSCSLLGFIEASTEVCEDSGTEGSGVLTLEGCSSRTFGVDVVASPSATLTTSVSEPEAELSGSLWLFLIPLFIPGVSRGVSGAFSIISSLIFLSGDLPCSTCSSSSLGPESMTITSSPLVSLSLKMLAGVLIPWGPSSASSGSVFFGGSEELASTPEVPTGGADLCLCDWISPLATLICIGIDSVLSLSLMSCPGSTVDF
ncbi:hypothetical protein ABW19_dt0202697 [Dactylella cylindrospora]|nr:hypothetical protein ABW19_dt0202697 [Dactylella cylindrospora]